MAAEGCGYSRASLALSPQLWIPGPSWLRGEIGVSMPRVSLLCLVGCLSACVLGLNACATQLLHTARTIEVGASPAQVREVLGTPYDRQFHRNQEAWQYCETGVLRDTFVVVWFVDKQVTGIRHYHTAGG